MNRGILAVAAVDYVRRITRLALPTEHCLVAIRPESDWNFEEWLIEGPHMAAAHQGEDVPHVSLIFMWGFREGIRTLMAFWSHLPETKWPVDLTGMEFDF